MMGRTPAGMVITGGLLALLLASVLVPGLKAANPQNSDVMVQVLGGTTELASEKAYETADIYFHAGMTGGCPDEEEGHVCTHAGGHDADTHQHADLPLVNVIERLHGETAPKAHRHLIGEEEKELLPWFVAAVRLNPCHIEAWRTGSYWFYRTGNFQHAEDFISDAIRHNPRDYRLYLDRGILYYRLKKWDKAVRDLEHARLIWKNLDKDSQIERRAILLYLESCRQYMQPNPQN